MKKLYDLFMYQDMVTRVIVVIVSLVIVYASWQILVKVAY